MTTGREKPRDTVERRAALTALAVGVLLMAAKFVAYAISGSAAVFADALESVVNIGAGGFAVWALAYSRRPADETHPYGHGKVEFLSALAEGGMIFIAAVVTAGRAIEVAWAGEAPQRLEWSLFIVAGAGLLNGLVGTWLVRVGRRGGSMVLEADGRHLVTDAVTSAALVVALVGIAVTGWAWLDPLAAMLMAGYLAFTGLRLVRRAAAGLMDERDDADDALLRSMLEAHVGSNGAKPRICSFHALRHRHVGRDHWVDFHLVVPAEWHVERGHEVATALEIELQRGLGAYDPDISGAARATAHIEPCQDDECAVCNTAAIRG